MNSSRIGDASSFGVGRVINIQPSFHKGQPQMGKRDSSINPGDYATRPQLARPLSSANSSRARDR